MPNSDGEIAPQKEYQKAQKEALKDGKNVVKQYFKDARDTGELPSQGDAQKQIDDRMAPEYDRIVREHGLSDDASLLLRSECRPEIHDYADTEYRKYYDKYHPEITGKEPYHLDKDAKKAIEPAMRNIRGYTHGSVKQFLNRCAKQGVCPSEPQFDNFLDGQLEDAKKLYMADIALTPAQEQWLRRDFEQFKPELQKMYKAYAGTVKITNTMPEGSNTPVGAVNGGTGTKIGADGSIVDQPPPPSVEPKMVAPKGPMASLWTKTNVSFSGCDMVVSANMRSSSGRTVSVVMGSVQTVSYSIYRKLSPINCIGNVNAKDYVGGPRTVAGSLVFTVFHQHWATDLLDKFYKAEGYAANRKVFMDEVAPIDLTISMANEFGVKSRLALYSVRLFSEGQVMSINDIYTENTYQYVALNVDYLANIEIVNDIWTPFYNQVNEYEKEREAAEAAAKVLPPSDGGSRTTQSVPEPEPEEPPQEEPKPGDSGDRTDVGPAPKTEDPKEQDGGHTKDDPSGGDSRTEEKKDEPRYKPTPSWDTIINVPNDLIENQCVSVHANGMTLRECIAEINRQTEEAKAQGKNLMIVRQSQQSATIWAKKLAQETVDAQEKEG